MQVNNNAGRTNNAAFAFQNTLLQPTALTERASPNAGYSPPAPPPSSTQQFPKAALPGLCQADCLTCYCCIYLNGMDNTRLFCLRKGSNLGLSDLTQTWTKLVQILLSSLYYPFLYLKAFFIASQNDYILAYKNQSAKYRIRWLCYNLLVLIKILKAE